MDVLYSVIIPAFNEENWLPQTLPRLKAAMATCRVPGEIIVVDNNSSDNTPRIAIEHGARIIFEPHNQISRARNTGARAAKGRYFIFLDADTVLPAGLLATALDNLAGGACCGGGALVTSLETPQAVVQRSMDLWNRLSRAFHLAAGCFIYCLRQGFEEAGGFSEKVYASEEIWFSRKLKAWGESKGLKFQIIATPPIITSARKLRWFSPIQLVLLLLVTVCPMALRLRPLCSFWYRRPTKK